MKRKLDHGDEAARDLAAEVFLWLTRDEERLMQFLHLSGLRPEALRASTGEPTFLGAVLDHVIGHEAALLACAADLGIKPERIAAAWRLLQPPDFDHTL